MCWKVPITIATKRNPAAVKFVLESMTQTVTVEGVGPEDYILVSVWGGEWECVYMASYYCNLSLIICYSQCTMCCR